jgi:hypothetical protein
MIIWGSRGKEKTMGEGQFFCPKCRILRPYKHQKIAKYFTLYFIPLFETKNLGEYVECQGCYTPFRTEILDYSQSLQQQEQENQEEARKVMKEISDGLDAGFSLQAIASLIKNAGGNEEAATAAIYAVTQGKIKVCSNCGAAYKASLSYCSICGTYLTPQ